MTVTLDNDNVSIGAKNATVTILTPFHPAAEDLAKRTFGKVLRPSTSWGEGDGEGISADDAVKQSDGILLRTGVVTENMIRSASKLKIISRNGTGWDNLHAPSCKERGVVVTNMPGGNAQAVAELALTLMLSVLRRVNEIDRRLRSGEVIRSIQVLSPGLFGKTVGLIGMGDTAYELALLLMGFNCKLLVYSPTSPPSRWTTTDDDKKLIPHERVSFETLLKNSDVLSLHCPLNTQTKNLISTKEIDQMKDNAVIINTARGGIIDEPVLANALREGKLGGAGIDVWVKEPPSLETMSGLAELDNVVCLPHLGGSTEDVTYEGCANAITIMADFFNGKEPINRVL